MRVRFSARALGHLENIRDYLHAQGATAEARRIRIAFQAALVVLSRFPRTGHASVVSDTFEWVVHGTRYIVVYEIIGARLIVLGVYHEAEDRSE